MSPSPLSSRPSHSALMVACWQRPSARGYFRRPLLYLRCSGEELLGHRHHRALSSPRARHLDGARKLLRVEDHAHHAGGQSAQAGWGGQLNRVLPEGVAEGRQICHARGRWRATTEEHVHLVEELAHREPEPFASSSCAAT